MFRTLVNLNRGNNKPMSNKKASILLIVLAGILTGLFTLLLSITPVKADNMICRDNGGLQVYIETDDLETPVSEYFKELGAVRVAWVSLSQIYTTIRLHGDGDYIEWRIGSIIPCIMIKEETNETTALKAYLSLPPIN